ncbi:hypothetical protein ZWY2020_028732 [Hordeum vulgare]|nr:hypothetical protein ZWY2020_028732 [Hordeum vulgare]
MDTVRGEAWSMAPPQQQRQPSGPRGPQPPPQQQNGRVDLRELKAQMEKRLGPDRSRRYFGYLSGYLSQKLSKPDFDKMCLLTLGRENLRCTTAHPLVLYNVYQAQCPPPPPDAGRSVGPSPRRFPTLLDRLILMQSSSGQSDATNDGRSQHLISSHDFSVAMQLNPQQLGEDWPVLLEKICLRPSEEND